MTEQDLLNKIEWVSRRDPLSRHQIELLKIVFNDDVTNQRPEGYYSVFHKIGQEIAYYDGVNWYLVGDMNAYKVTEFSSIGDKKIEI